MATKAIATRRKTAVKKYRKRNPGGGGFVPLLVIGGAVVAGWWYVNNYGPNGAVKNAAGQKVGASWWDQWFGSPTPTVQPVQPGTPGTTTPTNTAPPTPPGPARPSDPAPPPATGGGGTSATYQSAYDAVYATAVAHGQDTSRLNMDQWGYYYQQLYGPIDPSNGDAMINAAISGNWITDRSQPIPLGTFMQLLKNYGNVGLSSLNDLVPVSRWGSATTPPGAGIYSRNRGRRDVN